MTRKPVLSGLRPLCCNRETAWALWSIASLLDKMPRTCRRKRSNESAESSVAKYNCRYQYDRSDYSGSDSRYFKRHCSRSRSRDRYRGRYRDSHRDGDSRRRYRRRHDSFDSHTVSLLRELQLKDHVCSAAFLNGSFIPTVLWPGHFHARFVKLWKKQRVLIWITDFFGSKHRAHIV